MNLPNNDMGMPNLLVLTPHNTAYGNDLQWIATILPVSKTHSYMSWHDWICKCRLLSPRLLPCDVAFRATFFSLSLQEDGKLSASKDTDFLKLGSLPPGPG